MEPTREQLTVFVGGIPWTYTEADLSEHFKECGEMESIRMLNDDTGSFKGVCFITFLTKEGLTEALKYNDTDCGGRTLRVNPAESKGGKKGDKGKGKGGKGGKGKGKGPGEKPEGCKSIRVYGLGADTWDDAVRTHFESCGTVERVKVPYNEDETSRQFAFVDFESTEAVDAAIKLHESELDGSKIRVECNMPREKGEKGKGKDGKGKGKGKDGKGKGKGKKGNKDGLSAEKFGAKNGSIQDFAGTKQLFGNDSDSD